MLSYNNYLQTINAYSRDTFFRVLHTDCFSGNIRALVLLCIRAQTIPDHISQRLLVFISDFSGSVTLGTLHFLAINSKGLPISCICFLMLCILKVFLLWSICKSSTKDARWHKIQLKYLNTYKITGASYYPASAGTELISGDSRDNFIILIGIHDSTVFQHLESLQRTAGYETEQWCLNSSRKPQHQGWEM